MVRRDGAALQVSGYPARSDELCETVVVGLITQRSQVQILPPLLDGLTTTVLPKAPQAFLRGFRCRYPAQCEWSPGSAPALPRFVEILWTPRPLQSVRQGNQAGALLR